jgi:hypothetical protein
VRDGAGKKKRGQNIGGEEGNLSSRGREVGLHNEQEIKTTNQNIISYSVLSSFSTQSMVQTSFFLFN